MLCPKWVFNNRTMYYILCNLLARTKDDPVLHECPFHTNNILIETRNTFTQACTNSEQGHARFRQPGIIVYRYRKPL